MTGGRTDSALQAFISRIFDHPDDLDPPEHWPASVYPAYRTHALTFSVFAVLLHDESSPAISKESDMPVG